MTFSFLFDGAECSEPAPTRGGVASWQDGPVDGESGPAAISGVCNSSGSGEITITSRIGVANPLHRHYHGVYPSLSTQITSSLHLEDLCPSL